MLALTDALKLKIIGVTIATAVSAEAAMDLVEQHQYDCILCDVLLRGMDCIVFLRTVQARQLELSAILTRGR